MTTDKIPRGKFLVATINDIGDMYENVYIGSIDDLGESFFSNGEALRLISLGIDVYFIFNPRDMEDENARNKILPRRMGGGR